MQLFLNENYKNEEDIFVFGDIFYFNDDKRKIGFDTNHFEYFDEKPASNYYGLTNYNMNDLIKSLKTICSQIERFGENFEENHVKFLEILKRNGFKDENSENNLSDKENDGVDSGGYFEDENSNE